MKVVGIAGSLRAKSNTLQYVNTALNVLDRNGLETELISLKAKSSNLATVAMIALKKDTVLLKRMISQTFLARCARPKVSFSAHRYI